MMRRLLLTAIVAVLTQVCTGCTNDSTIEPNITRASDVSTSVPRPVMPNVVCMGLQEAQDLIQDQGVFFSRSEDASGQKRSQIIDSNWTVVDQNIAPGQRFDEGDVVLKVLKIDEVAARGLCGSAMDLICAFKKWCPRDSQ